ncbi:XRE family transcriptional regulator [Rhizobium sp. RMa-01]|uniref:helix-turn-helix domain-containing protein n=1 Tax=unclassified Rhizobium TaxID=2613769 RepID=UPI0008DA5590|nr:MULTISPECIES: helix-turn-helix transcriptional regulator [unclassified Rhizobium]OHV24960.1 transcriptional regulator [Rhizobium sp. RSm-3]RVU08333.1 XRE family transcriptional regulator [Rhizobium sp. RMa-01]
MAEMHGEWFHDQLKDRGKSLRKLAAHLSLDPSAVSRTFSGQRRMGMEEAMQIALFLGVPVSEVMKHAGIKDIDGVPVSILLAAFIDENGTLQGLSEPRPLPQSVIDKAKLAVGSNYDKRIIAAQVRASSGPLSIWDDAVLLFSHTDYVEPPAIGSLSICRVRGGKQILAKVERARKTGEASVISPAGKIEDAILETATPVIALIP